MKINKKFTELKKLYKNTSLKQTILIHFSFVINNILFLFIIFICLLINEYSRIK